MVFLRQFATARRMQVVVPAALLVCVLTLVVAPEVDLLPTVRQRQTIASWAPVHVAAQVLVFALRLESALSHFAFVISPDKLPPSRSSCLSITCSLLC
jgi:hypothetical protein